MKDGAQYFLRKVPDLVRVPIREWAVPGYRGDGEAGGAGCGGLLAGERLEQGGGPPDPPRGGGRPLHRPGRLPPGLPRLPGRPGAAP